MNTINRAIVGLALIASTSICMAELEGNIGITNNYVWRGLTQTQDQAAVSGGLDYTAESGFYAGTWVSNVDFGPDAGYELDLYLGYGGEFDGGVSYDVGFIYYAYPNLDGSDFSEVYGSLGFGGLSVGLSYQVDADFTDADYIYYNISYDVDLNDDYGLSLYAGNYDFDSDGGEVAHFGASISKGDFSFGLVTNDLDGDDDVRAIVSYGWTF